MSLSVLWLAVGSLDVSALRGQDAQIVKFSERTSTQLQNDLRVRGVLVGELEREIRAPVLFLYGVKPSDRSVCVHVERINGDYSADIEVSLRRPTVVGRAIRVDFSERTQHFERLRALPSSQVAISAKIPFNEQDCGSAGTHLPTAWHAEGGLVVSVLILNPNARARLMSPDGSECQMIADGEPLRGQHTTYDTVCAVQSLRECGPLAEVRIRRIATGGAVLTPIAAQIRRLC